MTVDEIITAILVREGGFVNHKNDRGGPTNFGVTQATYSDWLGRPATIEDVRNMTIETAREIYLKNYFYGPRLNGFPAQLHPQMVDMGVNHGPKNAVRIVQRVLNMAGFPCDTDGVPGPQTFKIAATAQARMGGLLTNAISEAREEFYRNIVARDPSQRVFLKGWIRRAREFRTEV